MGYVVYGAGAIGGVVGGRLFQAGLDVTLIARGRHLDALRAQGLRIESPAGSATVRIPAVGHPGEIDWSDGSVVLMAVKSQQTAAALAELAIAAPVTTPIICLQNGIANEPAALRIFPNVHAVCVMCPAGHLEPGVVQAWSTPTSGMLDIGRFPGGSDRTSHLVARDFAAATFSSMVVEDIRRWKHRKLLTNLGNVVEAVCGPDQRGSPLVGVLVSEGDAALVEDGSEELLGVGPELVQALIGAVDVGLFRLELRMCAQSHSPSLVRAVNHRSYRRGLTAPAGGSAPGHARRGRYEVVG